MNGKGSVIKLFEGKCDRGFFLYVPTKTLCFLQERKQDMQLAETQDVLRRIMLYDPSLSTQARALLGESMMNNIEGECDWGG